MLATAAEAIRIITALVYPILPESAAKVWRQLGLGEIQDAANSAFLTQLAWGGFEPETKFGEPAPLFPRAEKDAIERMQNLEDENNRTAVEAAGQANGVPPNQAPALTSVSPTTTTGNTPSPETDELTPTTAVPQDSNKPVNTAKVHEVPRDIASARLTTTPAPAPGGVPLATEEKNPDPPSATQQTSSDHAGPQQEAPEQSQHITIDDFAKVELRVAQVLVAERIPKADKLLRLEVDLGYEKRQILAGIAQHYEPEKLIGRKIVIVANLAPRKMRGLESNGMLLAASLPDGAPVLASFLEEVPLGARLK